MNILTTLTEARAFAGFRSYAARNNYTEIVTPGLVTATGACENIDTLFQVGYDNKFDWNERPVYLAQTGQLYLESLVRELGNVFCVGQSYRAELREDTRHLMQFTLAEIELPCNLNELLIEMENFIRAIVESCGRAYILPKERFARVTYQDAIEQLNIKYGTDLNQDQERDVIGLFGCGYPMFITHFPIPSDKYEVEKFFNMKRNDDLGIVLSADLLLPGIGEAAGAAEREHEYETVVKHLINSKMYKRLCARGGNLKDFDWYLANLMEHGNIPHSGCGFGMGRIVQWITNAESIHMTTSFPVAYNHIR